MLNLEYKMKLFVPWPKLNSLMKRLLTFQLASTSSRVKFWPGLYLYDYDSNKTV